MNWERRKKLVIRWSFVTAGLIALFWTGWYLINGSVPTVTTIKMGPTWTVSLPFSVSRWWDVLIGPIWSTILIFLLFPNEKIREDGDLAFGLAIGLAIGLVFGLVFGLTPGLVYGLATGLATGLAVGLVIGLAIGLGYLIMVIVSGKFWHSIVDWLFAR